MFWQSILTMIQDLEQDIFIYFLFLFFKKKFFEMPWIE